MGYSVISICLIVLAWCLFYWWPRRQVWAMAKKIPGPSGYPIIGNYLLVPGKGTELIHTTLKLFDDYGSIVRFWIGPLLVFFIKDPEDIKQILGNTKIRNRDWSMTKAMSSCLGGNLLTLRGEQWKIHRKLITPTFHFKILETYLEVFGRKSQILMKTLKGFEGQSFNVYNVLVLCTLDSICETAIGTAVNSLACGKSSFADCIQEAEQCIRERFLQPWLLIDLIYSLTSEGCRAKVVQKYFHEFSEGLIAQKLNEFRRGIRSRSITTASNKKVSSFLDMLIESSEAENSIMSPEEIRDEVIAMAFAGMDTSATTMGFFLVLIALHPEVQADIHQELDRVFGTDPRSAVSEDLQQLCVMERCIKETLRLFPIVIFIPREIDTDLKLPSGYVLPANSSAIIMSYAAHRDPHNFPEPDKFSPDRWLPENAEKTHLYAFIPFSAGPRNCVGQKYAQLQMKSVLSQILRRYRVTTPLTMDDLQKLDVSVTLSMDPKMKNPFHIQLHER